MRTILFTAALLLVAYYVIRRLKTDNDSIAKDFQLRRDLAAIGDQKANVWQRAEIPIMLQGEMPLTDINLNPWWPTPTSQARDAQFLPRVFNNPFAITIDPRRALMN